MENIKGIEQLRNDLMELEEAAVAAIRAELIRIGRTVSTEGWPHVPFNNEVSAYVDTIRLDEYGRVVCDTSFADTKEKELEQFISDGEIGHWDLIALLEILKNIDV
ncbi:MAG: hypothetical protein JST19_22350 [Bacteroidetes bacterium]|nr:hypothetical protein [Bacteroidota bacterium]